MSNRPANHSVAEQVDSTSTQAAMLTTDRKRNAAPSNVSSALRIRHFLELIRFSHTLFALPFAMLACAWALKLPFVASTLSPTLVSLRLLGVLLCMVTARSAAMAFNRLVDADIDALNPRTAVRHLPAGVLSKSQVWLFFFLQAFAFVASCTLFFPNWLPLAAALPVLAWICGYSLAKRFTSAAHLWLGVALALSPICAWVAIRGEEVLFNPADLWPACWLAMTIAWWVAGFDIIYACQDADYDRRSGLNSIPARYGIARALRIAAVFHGLMLLGQGAMPWLFPELSLGWLTITTWCAVLLLVVRQHTLVKANDLRRINMAFFNINVVISFGFSLAAALDAWLT